MLSQKSRNCTDDAHLLIDHAELQGSLPGIGMLMLNSAMEYLDIPFHKFTLVELGINQMQLITKISLTLLYGL